MESASARLCRAGPEQRNGGRECRIYCIRCDRSHHRRGGHVLACEDIGAQERGEVNDEGCSAWRVQCELTFSTKRCWRSPGWLNGPFSPSTLRRKRGCFSPLTSGSSW